jgi:hypothetical protein
MIYQQRPGEGNRPGAVGISLGLPQPRIPGQDDRLGAIGNLKLVEDVGNMVLHSFQKSLQAIGDLRIERVLHV